MRHVLTSCLLLASVIVGCEGQAPARVRLATTTSTHNSGLLDAILPPFERARGVKVEVLSVGTGQALELGRRGDVDIVLVHARAREDAFVEDGSGTSRADLMWNDFVIAGPAQDPAGVRGLRDAAAALHRIAETGCLFVSRGDDSGTHIREMQLWDEAGRATSTGNSVAPVGDYFASGKLLSAGQGMGATLTIADQKRAYVLVDRGTWLAFRERLALTLLVEGDERLRNPYGVILVNPARHEGLRHREARELYGYLLSPEGQRRIGEFEVSGETLFHPARLNE